MTGDRWATCPMCGVRSRLGPEKRPERLVPTYEDDSEVWVKLPKNHWWSIRQYECITQAELDRRTREQAA